MKNATRKQFGISFTVNNKSCDESLLNKKLMLKTFFSMHDESRDQTCQRLTVSGLK
jgi:hypothetical protein